MADRIPYNKKLDTGKQWKSGGPRDAQRRQVSGYGSAVIQLPNMSVEKLKELLNGEVDKVDEVVVGDKDGMTFDEVKKKIDDAVQFTIDQERKRYESSIKNLNDQLNIFKRKSGAIDEQVVEKNAEIKRLKNQAINGPQNLNNELEKKNDEINNLKIKIEEKDKVIEKLSNNYNENINILRYKIEEIDNKLVNGISITNEYTKDLDRPKIEDDVFIDPIEDNSLELDPHIKIKSDDTLPTSATRDIKKDLNKLKLLLNKSKDDSAEEINKDEKED